jgi:hypothetical protein
VNNTPDWFYYLVGVGLIFCTLLGFLCVFLFIAGFLKWLDDCRAWWRSHRRRKLFREGKGTWIDLDAEVDGLEVAQYEIDLIAEDSWQSWKAR